MTKENENVETNFANKPEPQCTYRCVSRWADKETDNHASTLKDPKAKIAGSVLHPPNEISMEKYQLKCRRHWIIISEEWQGKRSQEAMRILFASNTLQQTSK